REASGSTSRKPASPWKSKATTPHGDQASTTSGKRSPTRSSSPYAGPPRQSSQRSPKPLRALSSDRAALCSSYARLWAQGCAGRVLPAYLGMLELSAYVPLPYVIAATWQAGFTAFELASCTVPALFMH